MRKTIPIQPDGSIRISKELVEEVFGKAREAVVHTRSGCLVLSPVYIDIESGQLPQILARLHRFEALDTVMEGHFNRSDSQVVQFEGDLSVLSLNDVFLFLSASKKSGALVVQDRARWGVLLSQWQLGLRGQRRTQSFARRLPPQATVPDGAGPGAGDPRPFPHRRRAQGSL